MSIAVCALIRPSRLLRLALAAYALANAGAAVALALLEPARFHAGIPLGLACALAALLAWRGALASGNVRQIDISGPGEIRLSVQQSLESARAHSEPLLLLPGSTLWPSLLILLLHDTNSGRMTVVTILPDSVPTGQFRKIAVAIRSIARRDNKFSEKNKIL